MAKAFKGAPTMADFGDGGVKAPAAGASGHKGSPRVSARPNSVPDGPVGRTSPTPFKGGPSVVSYPSPKRVPGSGANNGAGGTTPQTDASAGF